MNEKTYVKLSLLILCVISLFSFAWAQDGVLSFETDNTTVNVGDVFAVRIKLNTGTHYVGVIQVRANFDDSKFSITTPDVTLNSAVWTLPSPEPPNVTGTLIKFTGGIAGQGVSGADVLVATLNFTCIAAGDGDITFVGGDDYLNSTMALDSTSFLNILGTLNDITITQAEPSGYDFETDAQGWQYSGTVPPFVAPTGTHNTVNGTLDITATTNSDNFGFWYSPMDAIPELTADNLYRIRFGVISDQVDKSVVPTFRVRFNSSNFKQGDFVMVNSNDAGDASPDDAGVIDYDLYMRPQNDALLPAVTGLLSFDMINMNPGDAPTATLSLDYVQIDKKAVADLGTSTTVQTYTFNSSEDGWSNSPAIAPYDPPIFAYDDVEGFLQMQCDDSNNTYGFWENNQTEISLNNGVLYELRVSAGTDANLAKILQEEPPLMRIRMYDHPSNQMIRLYQTPVWTPFEEPPSSKLTAVSFADNYVYFHDSLGTGPYLGIAVDIVNLDVNESPTGIVAFTEVELISYPIPSF
jgi:hypothetical protein